MSMYADILNTFTQKWIKEKLSDKDRAKLLYEITEDLDWGVYLDEDDALDDLNKHDKWKE